MDKKKTSNLTAYGRNGGRSGGRSGASSRMSGVGGGYRSQVHSSMGYSPHSLATASRASLASMSKKSLSSDSTHKLKKPQILGQDGEDLTPKSLLPANKRITIKGAPGRGEKSDSAVQASVYGSGPAGASFTQFSQPTLTMTGSILDTKDRSAAPSGTGSPTIGHYLKSHQPMRDLRPLVTTSVPVLSSEELDEDVSLHLDETDTIWMFGMESTWVDPDSPEAEEIIAANQRYKKLLAMAGSENFTSRGVQTFNDAKKDKNLQTESIYTKDMGVYASASEIYDTYQEIETGRKVEEEKEDDNVLERFSPVKTQYNSRQPTPGPVVPSRQSVNNTPGVSVQSSMLGSTTMDLSMMDSTSVNDVSTVSIPVEPLDPTHPNKHPIMSHPNIMDSLRQMERVILQNIYHGKQTLYRGIIPIRDPDHAPPSSVDRITITMPHLEKLWSYGCSKTRKLKVTCMTWNKSNEDILAVGYGSFNSREFSEGLICCWSIKNPEFPERLFHANSGVSAIDFAKEYPSLLAAGLLDGSILLYDIRSTKHEPVLDSKESTYKHLAPVWRLNWVMKEPSISGGTYSECLVSISMDGNILEWSIQKGLESSQIMHLKRMTTKKDKKVMKSKYKKNQIQQMRGGRGANVRGKKKQADAAEKPAIDLGQTYISQQAPGMGLSFSPKDPNVYLACTEEGYVYKCSCSYNEQFLELYEGHKGPVYTVSWSPFMNDYFLTCSADWSVKMWHHERNTPLHSFMASNKSICDVCWSPFSSTMFGCVSSGRVEIWDLHQTHLDPVIVHRPLALANQTCITFAKNNKIVIVGDSEGEVTVYLMKNLPSTPQDQKVAFQDAVKSMLKREIKLNT